MLCISIHRADIVPFGGVGIEDGEEGWGRLDVLTGGQTGRIFLFESAVTH